MIAKLLIRDQPHYRKHAFVAGLKRAGYEISAGGSPKSPADVLVIWNRYSSYEQAAEQWERHGGTVIVVENAYLGPGYAIAVGQHNGAGKWPIGDDDRFAKLALELAPWREGDYILVCGQRGVGSKTMASPANWHAKIAKALRTDRPIRVREHPGRHVAKVPLEDDLASAHACVVWSSGCGVKALASGVPVFYAAPSWICEDAARRPEQIDDPMRDDDKRLAAFQRMAHAQWMVPEIESGEPFARIRSLC